MSETSDKPETFYGPHSDKEVREFHNKHIHTVKTPRPSSFWDKLRDRGRRVESSTTYDVAAMDKATRVPKIFQHEGPQTPPLPEGKFITDRKGRMRRVGELKK